MRTCTPGVPCATCELLDPFSPASKLMRSIRMRRRVTYDHRAGAWYEPVSGRWWYFLRAGKRWVSAPYVIRGCM